MRPYLSFHAQLPKLTEENRGLLRFSYSSPSRAKEDLSPDEHKQTTAEKGNHNLARTKDTLTSTGGKKSKWKGRENHTKNAK